MAPDYIREGRPFSVGNRVGSTQFFEPVGGGLGMPLPLVEAVRSLITGTTDFPYPGKEQGALETIGRTALPTSVYPGLSRILEAVAGAPDKTKATTSLGWTLAGELGGLRTIPVKPSQAARYQRNALDREFSEAKSKLKRAEDELKRLQKSKRPVFAVVQRAIARWKVAAAEAAKAEAKAKRKTERKRIGQARIWASQ